MLKTTFIALLATAALSAQQPDHRLGYTDTPFYPGAKYRVHDANRPRPAAVTPGTCNAPKATPPSDARVLFDGTSLSNFVTLTKGEPGPASWQLGQGYMEVIPGKGDIWTKESFGDLQIHFEWAAPAEVKGDSQNRGNSGIKIAGVYEIQVLDSYNNPTYADGQAGAIYGQYPPLVNASCKPGEWQAYDIFYEAPRFQGETLTKPAYVTVVHNGILVQNHEQILGNTVNRGVGVYTAHGDKPLMFQNHNTPVRYRSIWVRPLKPRAE
jgi:hypothetical protein